MADDPIQRFTRLLLFQAQQDNASELVVSPTSSDRSPIRNKVNDVWYDVPPPPAHIIPAVIAELGRLAAFARRPFPKEGLIDMGGARWIIRMASADGDCILKPVDP